MTAGDPLPAHDRPADDDGTTADDGTTTDGGPATDEGLPPPEDAYWDDVTADTLTFLRAARAGYRRERTRATAYAVYVAVLLSLVYLVPYVLAALRIPDRQDAVPVQDAVQVLLGVSAVVLTVLVALVRDALWRGPALLDEASAGWLLAAPIRRGPLLRPRLTQTFVVGAVAGLVLGGTAGILLRLVVGGTVVLLTSAGAAVGVTTAVLGIGVAGLVEASTGRARAVLLRVGGWLWALPMLPAGYFLLVATGTAPSGTGSAPAPGPGTVAATWRPGTATAVVAAAAAVLAVGAAVVVAVAARRRIDRVPARVLRARAASVSAVAASVWTMQPRRARLLVELAQGRVPRPDRRLPVPGHRLLLWPWRDATALLRMPSRLLWGLVWIVTAGLLAAEAARVTEAGRAAPSSGAASRVASGAASAVASGGIPADGFALILLATTAAYLAAAQLAEAARLDADDPRAVRSLPFRTWVIVTAHVVTPALVLAGALAVVALAVAVAAGPADGAMAAAVLRLAAAVPVLVGAALVSAYRGDVPHTLLIGTPSAMGDTSPVQVLTWYARGPLVALALLLPSMLRTLLDPVADPRVAVPADLVLAAVPAAVTISWAVRRAHRILGAPRAR